MHPAHVTLLGHFFNFSKIVAIQTHTAPPFFGFLQIQSTAKSQYKIFLSLVK